MMLLTVFFFKQKTAYEMRISDWSSDVCSSDLPVGRLSQLINNLSGTASDLTKTFTYNPAGQIASVVGSNDAYAWLGHYNVDRSYVINGLNRIMNVGSTAFSYDGRGNLTNDGTNRSEEHTSELQSLMRI